MSSPDPLRIRRQSLDDGMVLVDQDPPEGSPSTAFSYVGPAGTAFDPAGREGTALLVGDLVIAAAGRRDRRALARHLDSLGATLSSSASPECLEITVWGPADRWEALLDLLADVVLRPRFEPSDIARLRRQLLERQLRESTQPGSRADLELLRSIFPRNHPYHRSGLGTRRTVGRIDRATLRAFHRGHFVPAGAYLAATSSVPRDRLARSVRRRFLDWDVERAPDLPEHGPPGLPRESEHRVRMPGRAQVEVRVGTASVPRSDPAFPALFLANEVLGGRSLLSRLFQRIREQAGLAYHASSDLESMGWGGFWQAQAGTGPERSRKVEALVMREFRRLSDELIPGAELDRIRESAIGSIRLELETTSGVHDLAVDSAYYGLPEDFYAEWPTTLRALSARAIRDAVAGSVDPKSVVLVTAGP